MVKGGLHCLCTGVYGCAVKELSGFGISCVDNQNKVSEIKTIFQLKTSTKIVSIQA